MTNGRTGPPDDAAIVGAMVGGSEAALETLYDRYAASIFGAVYRLTADRGIAEEVVQETFLTLWNRAESFDPGSGSLPAWLHAIARNRAIDRLRAAGRRPRLVEVSALAGIDEDPTRTLERVVADGTVVAGATSPISPEAAFEAAGLQDAIRTALTGLADDERTVILLAYQEDLSQSEIAGRLGWPLGTVKTRTRRALAQLRDRLGSEYAPVGREDVAPVQTADHGSQ
jgi:RNA polymerase sigma-70 factor, ECF subfamily